MQHAVAAKISETEDGNLSHLVTTHDSISQLRHPVTTHGEEEGKAVVESRSGDVWVKAPDTLLKRLNGVWLRQTYIERLWVVMDLILGRQAIGDEQNGFCPISTKTLGKMIGRDFACDSLRKLREIGFVECDNKYFPGKKAKGYKFTEEIAAIEAVPLQLSQSLTSRIVAWRNRRSTTSVEAHPSHATLLAHLQGLTLHPLAHSKIPLAGIDPKSQLRRDAWCQSAHAVDCRRWYFTHDPKSGRVFNNLTSLPKVMRRYVLLDGQPCAEIDIRNSQPLFMAGLYQEQSEEARCYAEIVTKGQFYEAIHQASGLPFLSRTPSRTRSSRSTTAAAR